MQRAALAAVLSQLLEWGVPVCAIVRSTKRLPAGAAEDLRLTVVVAEPASMSVAALRQHVAGRDAVVCSLGHNVSLRGVFGPPARDNQRAADFLAHEVGADDSFVEWVVVRPDSLVDGEVSTYRNHDGIVCSPFRADGTRYANVAHSMAEFATDDAAWRRWRGKMPVMVDDASRSGRRDRATERAERRG